MNEHDIVLPILAKAIEKAGGSRPLGRLVGVSHSVFLGWGNGKIPQLDIFLRVAEYAIPGYSTRLAIDAPQPQQPAKARGAALVTIWGMVEAGGADEIVELQEEADALDLNWGDSPLARVCRRADPVVYLRVLGQSMEPIFPHRCLIACKPPREHAAVPPGTVAVLADAVHPSKVTLKRYYPMNGRTRPYVIGQAINPAYPPVMFPQGAAVKLVVLGVASAMGMVEQQNGNADSPGSILREGEAKADQ